MTAAREPEQVDKTVVTGRKRRREVNAFLRLVNQGSWSPAKRCQYIEGEPMADDSCKCLKPTIPGLSWCEDHCLVVFRLEAVRQVVG